jgi:AbrB family looped-hinge helix DNA binding protein
MSYTATITSKGQVTIPIEVRKRLGLSEGDRIEFLAADGETVIRPARRHDNPFAKYRGVLERKLPATVKDIVREERETRGR